MQQTLPPTDRYYVHATSTPPDDRTQVLKQGETFAVFNRYGDIPAVNNSELGLYYEGTRFLSGFTMQMNGAVPILLSSTIRQDNLILIVDLTNIELPGDGDSVSQDSVHIARSCFLWEGVCYARIELTNFGDNPVTTPLDFLFDADFVDIFEVRGMRRERRGTRHPARIDGSTIEIPYDGLDGVRRTTTISFSPHPNQITEQGCAFAVELGRNERKKIDITIACASGEPGPVFDYDEALRRVTWAMNRAMQNMSDVETTNQEFNAWLDRSATDIGLMVTRTPAGMYPYAGVPWYSTTFGRDGIITALQMLWVDPELARGVLQCLANSQATSILPERDAEPGKVFHEMRKGEMANLNEHPFGLYYGSIDVTPLFVMLASEYYKVTGDLEFIREIEPNINAALEWIDDYGDIDGDGFLEYRRATESGLINQGWKDSHDSVFHADGSMAVGPIALCEVQGYAYAARIAAAEIARALGDEGQAVEYERQASGLKVRFNESFWDEELGTYVLALDGQKRPCRVVASNAGHTLFTGIAYPDRAAKVIDSLMSSAMFSGWGVRTIARGESRYNPMSYHNGSVWPHDNALIAAGMARYGFKKPALEILSGIFGAALSMDLQRLPELFCGFERIQGAGPVLYPVACLPQSWAAASVFMVLGACLGIEISAADRRIAFNLPTLPEYLDSVTITNLRVGSSRLDLRFHRYPEDVGVSVLRRDSDIEVISVK